MIALLLAAVIVPAGQAFTCTSTRVWDGDGPVWCAEWVALRWMRYGGAAVWGRAA